MADDDEHDVADVPGETASVRWPRCLERLAEIGAPALRFVPAVPGDVLGLPGPAAFNAAAATAGGAVLVDGGALGLLPAVTLHGPDDDRLVAVRWTAWAVDVQPGRAWARLSDADRQLTEQLQQAMAALERLGTSSFRPEAIGLLRTPAASASPLPPGWPDRAHRLLTRSQGVLAVIDVARRDDGLSVTATEAVQRDSILRDLHRAARQARAAAWNAGVRPVTHRTS